MTGHTQEPFVILNVLSGQMHVLLVVKVRFPEQVWHTLADKHDTQFVTLQGVQVDPELARVVFNGHTHRELDMMNVLSLH